MGHVRICGSRSGQSLRRTGVELKKVEALRCWGGNIALSEHYGWSEKSLSISVAGCRFSRVYDTVCTAPAASSILSREVRPLHRHNSYQEPGMAVGPIAPKQVDELRHLIEGMAKNFADRVYGPQGPEWGTQFADIEELAVQIGQAVTRQMCDQALQRQAARPVPAEDQVCPDCGRPTASADCEPRVVLTRAGDVHWQEPHQHCRRCRRSFFPSVEAAGD